MEVVVDMNTRELTANFRLTHWAQVMQERRESGMSNKEFCESIGIHENTYYYWQKKLRKAVSNGMTVKPHSEIQVPGVNNSIVRIVLYIY